jgi:hypothetical protein
MPSSRTKLLLTNGREAEIGSCPCDERGDGLRGLIDSIDYEKMKQGEIQNVLFKLALEALALFSPGLDQETAKHGLDFETCCRIRMLLWKPPNTEA